MGSIHSLSVSYCLPPSPNCSRLSCYCCRWTATQKKRRSSIGTSCDTHTSHDRPAKGIRGRLSHLAKEWHTATVVCWTTTADGYDVGECPIPKLQAHWLLLVHRERIVTQKKGIRDMSDAVPSPTDTCHCSCCCCFSDYISLSRKRNEESWTGVGTGSALNRKRQSSSFN